MHRFEVTCLQICEQACYNVTHTLTLMTHTIVSDWCKGLLYIMTQFSIQEGTPSWAGGVHSNPPNPPCVRAWQSIFRTVRHRDWGIMSSVSWKLNMLNLVFLVSGGSSSGQRIFTWEWTINGIDMRGPAVQPNWWTGCNEPCHLLYSAQCLRGILYSAQFLWGTCSNQNHNANNIHQLYTTHWASDRKGQSLIWLN